MEEQPSMLCPMLVDGPHFHPPLAKFKPPPRKDNNQGNKKNFRKPYTVALPKGAGQNAGQGRVPPRNTPCWNCGELGHWSSSCPKPRKNPSNQGNNFNRQGYVHYAALENIPTGEVVTAGMFPVNDHIAVVLFDSGASHSFMGDGFASKYDQRVEEVTQGSFVLMLLGLVCQLIG